MVKRLLERVASLQLKEARWRRHSHSILALETIYFINFFRIFSGFFPTKYAKWRPKWLSVKWMRLPARFLWINRSMIEMKWVISDSANVLRLFFAKGLERIRCPGFLANVPDFQWFFGQLSLIFSWGGREVCISVRKMLGSAFIFLPPYYTVVAA